MNSFYSDLELSSLGFKKIGKNVLISRKCSIYSYENISIGDNSRIDDFCLLSGNIDIGKNVHISAGCYIFSGKYKISFGDFSALSSQSTVYAISDDYSGFYLTNPTVSSEFRNIIGGDVFIGRHVIIGTGSTVLPNIELGEGCSFGAKSLINKTTSEWGMYVGAPVRYLKPRSREILKKEKLNK